MESSVLEANPPGIFIQELLEIIHKRIIKGLLVHVGPAPHFREAPSKASELATRGLEVLQATTEEDQQFLDKA